MGFNMSKSRSFYIVWQCVVWLLVLSAAVFAQNERTVKGRVLTSQGAPAIRLKFGKKFKFAGAQDFVLYDRARAAQFFFVESRGKKIERLYLIQFEGFLPDREGTYNYNEPRTVEIDGSKYFSNAEAIPDTEAALRAVPDSDIAKAAKFLREKGFELMKSLRFQRFVRVVDDARRSEFIILYVEDAALGLPEDALEKRARADFKILR
ncbi:MAG: hypothetical protein JSS81_27405 [Acidobacteria bacterium]|nr:hypothetical protein [Acidobacteriota bacterium]